MCWVSVDPSGAFRWIRFMYGFGLSVCINHLQRASGKQHDGFKSPSSLGKSASATPIAKPWST